MIQLGQSLFYKGFQSDYKPAIYLGKNSKKELVLVTLEEDGEIKETTTPSISSLSPCRQENKNSPTGMSIYMGGLAKGIYMQGDFKIKMPDEKLLKKEFSIIKTKTL